MERSAPDRVAYDTPTLGRYEDPETLRSQQLYEQRRSRQGAAPWRPPLGGRGSTRTYATSLHEEAGPSPESADPACVNATCSQCLSNSSMKQMSGEVFCKTCHRAALIPRVAAPHA